MTTDRMARNYLAQAAYRLHGVDTAIQDHQYAIAVRQSQEAVEWALKAALRAAGVEPPHSHDVGDVVLANASRLHPVLQEAAERLARISADLRRDREAAFYGDEAAGLTPDDLYGEADARRAREDASFVVNRVVRSVPPPTER
jgi:HEPN domain-containing protein